jgi:hypothetical protein
MLDASFGDPKTCSKPARMAASLINQTIQETALISVNRLDLPNPPKASEAIVRAKKWGCGVVTGGSTDLTERVARRNYV